MSRSRGSIAGGYVRKTVSLPKTLSDELEAYLDSRPGETLSAVLTTAGLDFLKTQQRKKGR